MAVSASNEHAIMWALHVCSRKALLFDKFKFQSMARIKLWLSKSNFGHIVRCSGATTFSDQQIDKMWEDLKSLFEICDHERVRVCRQNGVQELSFYLQLS